MSEQAGETTQMWGPTRFEIGEPWPWEPEYVAQRGFSWLPDSNMLLLVEDGVTKAMCEAVAGPLDMALLAEGPLVGMLVRFGPMWGWAEIFAWRRPGQGIPDTLIDDGTPTPHAFFSVVLVDHASGRIAHMRAFTASVHFTKSLYREVATRWADGTDAQGAAAAFEQFAGRYPDIDDALQATIARTHSGD